MENPNLINIPLELKIIIARTHYGIWLSLTECDRAFLEYSRSEPGKAKFIGSFSKYEKGEFGGETWTLCGKLHREDDLPAFSNDYRKMWHRYGKLHRENDLPAVIWSSGTQRWYQNGVLHRGHDLPAVVLDTGTKIWYPNGEKHRDNDKPAFVKPNDIQQWYRNGILHRDGGKPAVIIFPGVQEWYQEGIFIRRERGSRS